jgi:hypothetical protein
MRRNNLERGAMSEPEVVEFTVQDRKDSAPVHRAHGRRPQGFGASVLR